MWLVTLMPYTIQRLAAKGNTPGVIIILNMTMLVTNSISEYVILLSSPTLMSGFNEHIYHR